MSKSNDDTIGPKHIYSSGWLSGYLYAKKKRLNGAEVLALHKKAMNDYDEIYGDKTQKKEPMPIKEKHTIEVKEYGSKTVRKIEI